MGACRLQNSARKDLKKSSSPCDCARAAVAVGEILSGSVCQQRLEAAAGDRPGVGRGAACSRGGSGTELVPVLLPHGGLGRSKPPGSGAVWSRFATGLADSRQLMEGPTKSRVSIAATGPMSPFKSPMSPIVPPGNRHAEWRAAHVVQPLVQGDGLDSLTAFKYVT